MDVDRLRALPGARPHLRGDRRTAELLSPGLHGQDSQLGPVWSPGARLRPGRHAVPAAEQTQRHFRMLRCEREGPFSQSSEGQFTTKKNPKNNFLLFFFLRKANRNSVIFSFFFFFFFQHLGQRTALLLFHYFNTCFNCGSIFIISVS